MIICILIYKYIDIKNTVVIKIQNLNKYKNKFSYIGISTASAFTWTPGQYLDPSNTWTECPTGIFLQ